jgi:GT2 family glycosyltransferase
MTSVGCVVLSMGARPAELSRALDSLLRQRELELDIVVVGNGWSPVGLPDGVRPVALTENVGIPQGRNVGAAEARGDVLFFLDDDAELESDDVLARAVGGFDADSTLGVVQLRSIDPNGAPTDRRHVPRLRASGPMTSGDVAWFWEGAALIRRTAFDAAGGWPGEFFYGHEGIEVAWRVIDAGYRVHYGADLGVLNPAAEPFRGPQHRYLNARNRVWVARRNLPVPLAAGYLAVWSLATVLRSRSWADLRAAIRGFADGARQPCGERRPISRRTAWQLTRLGRPPIV